MINPPCYIHSSFSVPNKDDVRNEVCRTLSTEKYSDGNYYCFLHLPDENKNPIEFRKIINERNRDIENEIDLIVGKTISDDEKETQLNEIVYDFRYVYFPEEIHFNKKSFKAFADFGWTTFKYVLFNFAEFKRGVNFTSAKFTQDVSFNNTTFFKGIRFDSATFEQEANFRGTKINNDIYFNEGVFEGKADFLRARFNCDSKNLKKINQQPQQSSFSKAKFRKEVDFRYAHFFAEVTYFKAEFHQEASFRYTKFHKEVNFKWTFFSNNTFFDKSRFRKFVDFSSSTFAENSDLLFRKTTFSKDVNFSHVTFAGYATFESQEGNVVFNNDCFLSFEKAYVENPEKIAFNNLLLRPSWFINTNSRKFIFSDVRWKNVDNNFTKANVSDELKYLRKEKRKNRVIGSPIALFKVTCRQLAENAENNNRFEEASNFRRMAMETEWLERKETLIKPTNVFGFIRRIGDFIIHALYRITSYYGESWSWALFILFCVLGFFTVYFHFANFYICSKGIAESAKCVIRNMSWGEAIHQSVMTAALQTVENRKTLTEGEDIMILLEKIMAPIQAALLALAIRRKFMR